MVDLPDDRSRRWLPARNMSGAERVVRVVAGALLALSAWSGGGVLDLLQGPARTIALVVLVLGAVDLVISGAVGYCPLYRYVRAPGTPGRSG